MRLQCVQMKTASNICTLAAWGMMLTENALTAKLSFRSRVSSISKGHTNKMENKIINWMRTSKRRSKKHRLRGGSLMKSLPLRELFFQVSRAMRVQIILTSSSKITRLNKSASTIKETWTKEIKPARMSEKTFLTRFFYVLKKQEKKATSIKFLESWISKNMMFLN